MTATVHIVNPTDDRCIKDTQKEIHRHDIDIDTIKKCSNEEILKYLKWC